MSENNDVILEDNEEYKNDISSLENAEYTKPITIVRAEFIDNLVNMINGSTLPLFVIEPILKDIYFEVKSTAQKQYEQDKYQYESYLNTIDADHDE